MGLPARGYSRPPFQKGNQVASNHGIANLLESPDARPPTPAQLLRIEAKLQELLDEFPFLHDADLYELRRLARLQYEIDVLAEYADQVRAGDARVLLRGMPKGSPTTGLEAWYASGLADQLGKLIEKASNLSKALGLNPSGRFAIAKDLYTAKRIASQQGVADLISRGRGRLQRSS